MVTAIVVHVALAFHVRALDGWWWDELFSLWASEPSLSFAEAFTARIFPDSNPPLHGVLLWLARQLTADPGVAAAAVNYAAIVLAGGAVLRDGWRSDQFGTAAAATAVFLVSGTTLAFVIEARSYTMAMAATFATAWFAARATEPGVRPRTGMLLAFGVLAALSHVFGAIAACAAIAGAGIATVHRARDTWPRFAAAGFATAATVLVWYVGNTGAVERIAHIQFKEEVIRSASTQALAFIFGSPFTVIAVISAVAGAIVTRRSSRTAGITAGLASALFVAVPVVASYAVPIIGGRYLFLGGPLLTPLLVTCAARARGPTGALVGLVVAAMTVGGIYRLPAWMEAKPTWWGTEIVAAKGRGCPPGSIRTAGSAYEELDTAWVYGAAFLTGLPEATFAVSRPDATLPPAGACPVLGWLNHIPVEYDDARVLERLRLTDFEAPLAVVSGRSSYVVLAQDPATP